MMTIDELKYKLEDNSRLIGLDLGTKRVGVAISDNKRKNWNSSPKKNTANNELKTGTMLVYKPDLEGPIFSTPFIKKICANND